MWDLAEVLLNPMYTTCTTVLNNFLSDLLKKSQSDFWDRILSAQNQSDSANRSLPFQISANPVPWQLPPLISLQLTLHQSGDSWLIPTAHFWIRGKAILSKVWWVIADACESVSAADRAHNVRCVGTGTIYNMEKLLSCLMWDNKEDELMKKYELIHDLWLPLGFSKCNLTNELPLGKCSWVSFYVLLALLLLPPNDDKRFFAGSSLSVYK